jgi:predicted  nucleic acid-binding Zn-ribbon protein
MTHPLPLPYKPASQGFHAMMNAQFSPNCHTLFPLLICATLLVSLTILGCQNVYYDAMEKMGYPKRDLLVRDVEKARDAQQAAKVQFKSALDRFTTVLSVKGGELQDKYDSLNTEYEESEDKANAVRDRIASVEDVSQALFKEWEAELIEYSSAALRQSSQRKLTQTRTQYAQLMKAMKRAETKMDPVLAKFKDQVLFLKHNLNAQAIASLKNELVSVEGNIASLMKEMETSIKEADSFIASMAKEHA